METITVEWVESTFPRPMTDEERSRAQALIDAAEDRLLEEFERNGRDLPREIQRTPWLARTVRRVVREMVAAAVHVGGNVGQRSASSSTGPQSDQVTWSEGIPVTWGGVLLTHAHRRDLGLIAENRPRWHFPRRRFLFE